MLAGTAVLNCPTVSLWWITCNFVVPKRFARALACAILSPTPDSATSYSIMQMCSPFQKLMNSTAFLGRTQWRRNPRCPAAPNASILRTRATAVTIFSLHDRYWKETSGTRARWYRFCVSSKSESFFHSSPHFPLFALIVCLTLSLSFVSF